jgi:hypothetical protein
MHIRSLGDEQPGGRARKAIGFQHAAQSADERLDHTRRVGGRIAPEIVDQRRQGNDPPARHDQPGEDGSMTGALERDRRSRVVPRGHRSEDTETDGHPAASVPCSC